MPKALVVLSGGQDSTTCLFWAVQQYGPENVYALTFNYGQRHLIELEAARHVASLARIKYAECVDIGPILAGSSPLTDHSVELEQYANHASMEKTIGSRVELTFVPMRNALFLTLAANRASVWGCKDIVTGVSQEDNANYPDCRHTFIRAQEEAINKALGDQPSLYIMTPLIHLSKSDSVVMAWNTRGAYGALAYSHTAYDGQFPPVGHDHATILRAHGFQEAGLPDPLVLRAVALEQMIKPETSNYSKASVEMAVRHIQKEPWYDSQTHGWVRRLVP
jgi:7-cyano-7-deazaguanine synthase